VTSSEIEAADAQAPHQARRIRGLSVADAIAVVFVAGMVGVFLEPNWPVGIVLVAAIAGVYAVFRASRGLPMRRRLIGMTAVFVIPLSIAAVLVNLGY
jgi:hypothetical protein